MNWFIIRGIYLLYFNIHTLFLIIHQLILIKLKDHTLLQNKSDVFSTVRQSSIYTTISKVNKVD